MTCAYKLSAAACAWKQTLCIFCSLVIIVNACWVYRF